VPAQHTASARKADSSGRMELGTVLAEETLYPLSMCADTGYTPTAGIDASSL
jgi:hypothetical protein